MARNEVSYRWHHPHAERGSRSGVSLHSHTLHSRESLDFIPRYARRVPLLARAVQAQAARSYRRADGEPLDFGRAYWTPPLGPREAFDVERCQIEQKLGLAALVSLTDHDTIEANLHLQMVPEAEGSPISVEWTVPFHETSFHLGVHNLPADSAPATMRALAAHTARPRPGELADLLALLNTWPGTLVVLNHPLWDELRIGQDRHTALLRQLLRGHAWAIHAFELNGLRPWRENRAVLQLAEERAAVVVSGGDRHGLEPNANVNLSAALTFPEFVEEIRVRRRSHVLFLPQYRQPYRWRVLQGLLDVIRHLPDLPPSRVRWDDRVYYRGDDGVDRPLSAWWEREPWLVKRFLQAVRLLDGKWTRELQRALVTQGVAAEVPSVRPEGGPELA